MEFQAANHIVSHVRDRHPKTWGRILKIIRPHRVESIVQILAKHLLAIPDLDLFNRHVDKIHSFLLAFCRVARRNFLQPGDPYGILLTCRTTKIYTQDTLDKRHLRDTNETASPSVKLDSDIAAQLDIYASFSQITEITCRQKYATLLVCDHSVEELLNQIRDSCVPISADKKGVTGDDETVYLFLKKYVIFETWDESVCKILYKSCNDLDHLLTVLPLDRIVGFTDVKYVFEKCGIACFFFNFLNVIRHQFFKERWHDDLHRYTRNQLDLVQILKFMCCNGVPLSLNRTGLRKNPNRSSLEILCFEAVKQNYVFESVKAVVTPVRDSLSRIYFGQQFNEGTGYSSFGLVPQTIEKK